ncbi:histidine--tRNA ligase [Ureaplasma miroungigenitalium]|uniref:Histidine--tRNA ligase n=1 Tax=Ureaplasma miroungigenitalium TaxID=1042321 RepID=A0ABT3BM98_9BACT|nr:histidine--tRNA ligase [Ureaplasma miroungigenitalium]MCV3728368.1 histidine--tRNA ligase [Ureaplasma miroungigenitalium]MCV3734155.1 histidine--tRNA ligase [Ureaplasma miroungigenitalium]
MKQIINKIRGTVDLFKDDMRLFKTLENHLLKIADNYGYEQVKTPVFEHYELFNRSAGETSDLVSKEMYVFNDKGNRMIALRPEGTAGVLRAVIENKWLLQHPLPLKLAYFEPCFRYERPQSGRQRMFHQFGVELLGSDSIYTDFEVICMAYEVLTSINIKDFVLEINYISTPEKRALWIKALQDYFAQYIDQLEVISRERLQTNPLRILDDKIESQKTFVQNAPKISAFLDEKEKEEFATLLNALEKQNIKYKINENLVRGLDYYTGVVFEFISLSERLVGQSTMIGGGRYTKLLSQLNGPDYNGVGFGCGIERLLIALKDVSSNETKEYHYDYMIGYTQNELATFAHSLTNNMRTHNLKVDVSYEPLKFDKIFKKANKIQPRFIVLFAEKEWADNQQILLIDEQTKQQTTMSYIDILEKIKKGEKNEN